MVKYKNWAIRREYVGIIRLRERGKYKLYKKILGSNFHWK